MKKSVAYLGVFLALAMILSYVEAILPFAIGIPGVKLGLANLVTVLMLYLIGWREALCVSVLRIVLTGILFGIKLCTYVYSDSDKLFSCSYGQYLWRNHT